MFNGKTVVWSGEQQCAENSQHQLDPLTALAAAKRGANEHVGRSNTTCRSTIIIGEGEGRATCELEIKWFPSIYGQDVKCGKMCMRFYVAKLRFGQV